MINPLSSGSLMMGSIALGLPTQINPLERNNRWFRQQIADELHIMKADATLPTSFLILVKILIKLWQGVLKEGCHRIIAAKNLGWTQ